MKTIELMARNENLVPISIWSEHNEKYPLSNEQKRIRDVIFETGYLPEPYNVLIINRALETGVNIYDESFKLFISCTSNKTQTYQARSRLRMDVDIVILKSSFPNVPNQFLLELDEKYLDTPLTKEDIDYLLIELNIRDEKGKLIGIKKFLNILDFNGYTVKDIRKKIKGKQRRYKIISR